MIIYIELDENYIASNILIIINDANLLQLYIINLNSCNATGFFYMVRLKYKSSQQSK